MFLIDGYNLLLAGHGIKGSLESRRDSLIRQVHEYCEQRDAKAVLVFDSIRAPHTPHPYHQKASARVKVHFTGKQEEADDEILRQIQSCTDRTALTVVSSDQKLRTAAKKKNLEVVSSKEFREELEAVDREGQAKAHDPKIDGISTAEAQEWMKIFGLNEGDDIDLSKLR